MTRVLGTLVWPYALLLLLLLLSTVALGQVTILPFSAKVSVQIIADDEIRSQAESYSKRELRSIGDVVITEDEPRWVLDILITELKMKSGYTTGVAMSVVILDQFDNGFIAQYDIQQGVKELLLKVTKGLSFYPDHWLRVGSTEELRQMCNKLISDFDSKHLEQSRKIHQNIKKSLEKR